MVDDGSDPAGCDGLIPIAVFPLAGVASFSDVGSPYASSTIFLFLGGFLLALGLQRWNVHRRIALGVVLLVGTSPKRLVLGFMLATGFMSMWVSNTATAVVMLPIGISVLSLTADTVGGWRYQKKFATGLMLAIAYAASIGSLGTLIGTPPNALLAGYMKEAHDITIGFGQWMMVGVPVALVFTIIAWLVLVTVFKPEMDEIPGGKELIREEIKKMGHGPAADHRHDYLRCRSSFLGCHPAGSGQFRARLPLQRRHRRHHRWLADVHPTCRS